MTKNSNIILTRGNVHVPVNKNMNWTIYYKLIKQYQSNDFSKLSLRLAFFYWLSNKHK